MREIDMNHLLAAFGSGDVKEVERLLGKGANVNVKNEDGNTPIHFGAFGGNLEVVQMLIEKGADVNVKNRYYGNTPLHVGAGMNNLDVVKELLKAGADPSLKNKVGRTALDAADSHKMRELLEKALQKQQEQKKAEEGKKGEEKTTTSLIQYMGQDGPIDPATIKTNNRIPADPQQQGCCPSCDCAQKSQKLPVDTICQK